MNFKQDFITYTKDELIKCLLMYLSGYQLSKLEENKDIFDVSRIENSIQNIAALLQKRYLGDNNIWGLLLALVPKKFKNIIQCSKCKGRIDIIEFEDNELKEKYGADTRCYCHNCGILDYLLV